MTERFTARILGGSARRLTLGKVIHKGGGAGRIVAVAGDPASVVKLYHDPATAASYEAKIEAMLERPPALAPIEDGGQRFEQIAWPKAIVEDQRGAFRGFVMPFIDLSQAAPLETLLVKALRRHHGLPENYGYRMFAAQNVAAAVAALHRAGHHIIDLKPQNLSIYKRTMYVAVVDCDGLAIDGGDGIRYPAGQFTDGYRAPEAVAGGFEPHQLGETQDRFALAVVLFQLLNNGIHPFQGVPRRPGDVLGTEQERINAGLYPYGAKADGRQSPSPGSIHDHFETETDELFRRAFDSRYRPSAGEWRDHLRDLIQDGSLQKCASNPDEHAHFSKGCGLCAVEAGKTQRVAEARQRARTQVLNQRPQKRARPKLFGRAGAYKVIFRRTSHSHSHGPKTAYPRTPRTANTGFSASGPLLRLWKLIFGTRTRPVPHLPASPATIIGLCIVYGLFVLNMLALSGIVTSVFMPKNFYDFGRIASEIGLAAEAETLSLRDKLVVAQAYALTAVFASTILAQIVCEVIRRAAIGTFVETHAQWLVRTFWLTPLVALAAFILGSLTWPWGLAAIACLPLWLFHRLSKGLQALVKGQPILAPTAIV
jgi:uncharacterized membrane protein